VRRQDGVHRLADHRAAAAGDRAGAAVARAGGRRLDAELTSTEGTTRLPAPVSGGGGGREVPKGETMAQAGTVAQSKGATAPAGELPGGYAGKLLRVDLGSGRTWSQPWTPAEMRFYLGGVGIGAKVLWEEVPPEVGWDHPDNRLVLATGPFAGLPVW